MRSQKNQLRWAGVDLPPARLPRIPVQVTFRHLPVSPAVVQRVTAEAQKLRRYAEAIKHCHAVVISPHRHHRQGRRYAVHLEIGMPGRVVAIAREPAARVRSVGAERIEKRIEPAGQDKDLHVVIRQVFDAARRRLQDRMRRMRGEVKHHAAE